MLFGHLGVNVLRMTDTEWSREATMIDPAVGDDRPIGDAEPAPPKMSRTPMRTWAAASWKALQTVA